MFRFLSCLLKTTLLSLQKSSKNKTYMNWYLAYAYGCLYFGIDLVHTGGTSRGQLRHTGAAQDANTEPFGKFVNNFHAEGKDKPCASKSAINTQKRNNNCLPKHGFKKHLQTPSNPRDKGGCRWLFMTFHDLANQATYKQQWPEIAISCYMLLPYHQDTKIRKKELCVCVIHL